jgi:RNA polymerase sigma-70 factor, ECF subfamily
VSDPSVDDAELLSRTAAGDDAAFASFVSRHQDGVWRRARALARQPADAEDLMQEAFVAAWRGAAGFRGGSARSWLLTIVTHAWQRARVVAREEHANDETLELLAARAGWGERLTDAESERGDMVAAAFARLTPPDREVLMLRDVESLPGDEVAATLGLSLPAMKSRLHRARLRLAAAYEEVRRGST